ncbi:MAG: alpha/beta hydrolase fold protein [Frankiales bacterium]|nr:alpha/beta hydrolase fold protein [Frankiales bacterium]
MRFASYDGAQLSYTAVGTGPALVCVPGGPGRAVAYLEDLAGLSATRTLVLLDPRATGHSEVPADPSTLRFDRMGEDLEALREHLGLEQLDVLGHSAGTLIAQAWASAHPQSVGRLVLVTPSDRLQGGERADIPAIKAGFAEEPWYEDAARAEADLEDAPPSQRASLERLARPFSYGRWDERCQEHAATADHQCSKRALLGFGFGAEEVDLAALLAGLRAVTAPVLVVGGARDGLTGVESVQLVGSCFPHAQTIVIEGAGHYPWVDQPQAFRTAVERFLL